MTGEEPEPVLDVGDATNVSRAASSRESGAVRVSLATISVVLGLMAQYLLTIKRPIDRPVMVIAIVLYAAAIGAFVVLGSRWRSPSEEHDEPLDRRRRPRVGSLLRSDTWWHAGEDAIESLTSAATAAPLRAAGVVLALATGLFGNALLFSRGDVGDNYFDLFGLWLLSIGLYLVAFVGPAVLSTIKGFRAWTRDHGQALVDVGLLTLLALALRVLFVGSVPNVLGGDEALVGLVARGFLENPGNMFATTFAYSDVYHMMVAGAVELLGSTATAIRVLGAVLAALAVPLSYLAGREMFGRRVGLVAGFLVLASHQHIHSSRTGHAHGVDAFVVAWVLFAFACGLRRRSLGWMAVAGVGLGAAQYVYVGSRAIDLVIAAFVVLLGVVDWSRLRSSVSAITVAFGASVVTAGPMVVWAIRRPGDYLTRMNQTGLVQSGAADDRVAEGLPVVRLALEQMYHAVLAPIAYPTANFYDARLPMVDMAWAFLFVLGLGLAISRFRQWRYLLLVVTYLGTSFAILALGNLVQASNYRVMGALPVYAILAGVALVVLVERGLANRRIPASWPAVAGAAVVALIAGYNVGYYFLDHVPNCVYMSNDDGTSAVSLASMYIADNAEDAVVMAVTEPSYFVGSYPNGEYLTGRKTVRWGTPDHPQPGMTDAIEVIYNLPVDSSLPEAVAAIGSNRPVLFWVSAYADANHSLDEIAAEMPGGKVETLSRCGEDMVHMYLVPEDG